MLREIKDCKLSDEQRKMLQTVVRDFVMDNCLTGLMLSVEVFKGLPDILWFELQESFKEVECT